METSDLYKERTEKFKKIVEFLVAIDKDSKLIEKKDRRKNREGNAFFFIPSADMAEKLEIGECYVDELDFDINLIRLWALVEIIESLGYSLVVYPDECYWLTEDGDYLVEETFTGEKRINFVFDACMNFISQYK